MAPCESGGSSLGALHDSQPFLTLDIGLKIFGIKLADSRKGFPVENVESAFLKTISDNARALINEVLRAPAGHGVISTLTHSIALGQNCSAVRVERPAQ